MIVIAAGLIVGLVTEVVMFVGCVVSEVVEARFVRAVQWAGTAWAWRPPELLRRLISRWRRFDGSDSAGTEGT